MNRRDFVQLTGTGLLAAGMPGIAMAVDTEGRASSVPRKPNIVLILTDDLGWGSLGCYGARPDLLSTPNSDRLAREGIRFTDACTPASICSPTRYGLLTGRYCWRTSLKKGVLNAGSPLHIETNRLTMASLLKDQGYRTAAIGKWHLGFGITPADYTADIRPGPLEVGFDHFFGVPSNHGDSTGIYLEDHRVFGLRSAKREPFGRSFYGGSPYAGFDAPQRDNQTVMSTLTDKAIGWIEQQKQPFFLYFTPVAVHEPVTPSDQTKGTSKAGPYGDWIHELDRSVGRLLDALDRLGVATNTLVILTSDNGGDIFTREGFQARAYKAGLTINGAWRGGKHSIYEGGFRVPFIARWPGHIPAGAVSSETINLVDLLATTAAIVNAPLPTASQGAEDSRNVLPALLGQKTESPLRPVTILHDAEGTFAVRRAPWKWIEGRRKAKGQLYNLADDPAEKNDVLAQHPEIARELAAVLEETRNHASSVTR